MESHGRDEAKGPVLHIVVVGFHHKKGCQVEFSYPPLMPDEGHDSNLLPEEWKYLPFLALPDGAHNYQEGTSRLQCKVFYGPYCERLRHKHTGASAADGVCFGSQPLYGLLQAKLQLITHAYFEEKDFSQIFILKELYDHMNSSLKGSALDGSQVYLGLSPRDLILHFRHKALIMFKLILLEKKVLFYVSPVNRLVGALMTVLSLFPGMIEHGLVDSSHYRPKSSVSEDASLAESVLGAEEFVSVSVTDISSESDWETLDPSVLEEGGSKEGIDGKEAGSEFPETFDSKPVTPITVQPQSASSQGGVIQGLVSGLEEDQYGLPLAIFTKGYLCLPYMALQQHHLLSDVTVRGFVAGATNILFRQQRHLSDAIVEVEEARIQIHDPELRKILNLTTADLRFADYVVKHVTENRDDVFLDGTGWEGGDEWIRAQFTLYLHSLLSSALQEDNERLLADYGAPFIAAWKNTHNYRVWYSNKHPAMTTITPGHPFQGQYSVADVKLRLSHSVQNSERGKKIGNAMMTTSRSMVQTGKAVGQSVGGALTTAKSAMSSWFSTLAQPAAVTPPACPEPATEVKP
uniref:UDENN domain-containing protein n=1 Tax=Anabas testudineus TaxID=64144 RepID=A0A7N6AK89_ANATE